jgi:phage tail-like protein
MDVNGSRFALLLGCTDWSSCTDEDGARLDFACGPGSPPEPPADSGLVWDSARHELTLQPLPFTFTPGPTDRPPKLTDRRGAGRDSFGSWYWIDPTAHSVLVQSSGSGLTTTYWPDARPAADDPRLGAFSATAPLSAPATPPLRGAAVTEDNFLVIGVLDPPGLLVFDLQTGDPPAQLPWDEVAFTPLDMAPRPGGGVFVLDRDQGVLDPSDHHCRVWELDRHFHVVSGAPAPATVPPGSFAPPGGPPSTPAPASTSRRLSPADATSVPADVIAIEAVPGGGFFALHSGESQGSAVSRYRDGGLIGASAATAGLSGYDLALVGDRLLMVDAAGKQTWAFGLTEVAGAPALELLVAYYPMREFGGRGLVAAGDRVYYDFEDRWIPLVAQARPRHVDAAAVVTPAFDSGTPACTWHRLIVDASLPQGTRLAVWSKAADDKNVLGALDWVPEPAPLPRRTGCELPFVPEGPYDTHELLFQNPQGRYLMVKLELVGDGRVTPRVRALRAWYPRFSYLTEYLPRVYREDRDSASFLERYLANVEGFYTEIEDRIVAAQVFFGTDTAPAEDLDWLAGWYALTLDPLWDENRRRVFLRNANTFFQARGTMRGVEIALRFAFDPCVDDSVFVDWRPAGIATARIVEAYRTRKTPGVVLGDPTDQAVPRVIVSTSTWTPDQKRDVLNAGWLAFVEQHDLSEPKQYPILAPQESGLSSLWSQFSAAVLGFVPAKADPTAWSSFLSRRYASTATLATKYGLSATPTDFSDVPPPTVLPPDGAALVDWFQFQSVVIPMGVKANRFTVLLPWPLHVTDARGVELDNTQLRDLATRIVDLQKPAHTTYTVKFYWAAFRIGDARLGDDTLLASGSRVPELVTQAVLGTNYLGDSYLGGPAATDVIRRTPPALPPRPDGAEDTQ